MTHWIIIPVKPLRYGKSRLASVLSEGEREVLNRHLLTSTLSKLTTVQGIGRMLVVSRDPAVLSLAREFDVITLQEHGTPDLNLTLQRATIFVRQYTVRSVLILPADLPNLDPQEVKTIFEQDRQTPTVVVVPDRHHQGTNGLLVDPPGLLQYDYGPGSFKSHCLRAKEAGANLVILELPSLALDLDLPEDLELCDPSSLKLVTRKSDNR